MNIQERTWRFFLYYKTSQRKKTSAISFLPQNSGFEFDAGAISPNVFEEQEHASTKQVGALTSDTAIVQAFHDLCGRYAQ